MSNSQHIKNIEEYIEKTDIIIKSLNDIKTKIDVFNDMIISGEKINSPDFLKRLDEKIKERKKDEK